MSPAESDSANIETELQQTIQSLESETLAVLGDMVDDPDQLNDERSELFLRVRDFAEGTLRDISERAKIEDDAKDRNEQPLYKPADKVARRSLVEVSNAPEVIDLVIRVRAHIHGIEAESRPMDTVFLVNSLNSYDAYVNMPEVLGAKGDLIDSAENPHDPKVRMAASLGLTMAILENHRRQGDISRAYRAEAYREAVSIAQKTLKRLGIEDKFSQLGFTFDDSGLGVCIPNGMRIPPTNELSPMEDENTFIMMHQMTEPLFDEIIRTVEGLYDLQDEGTLASELDRAGGMLKATGDFMPVMKKLLHPREFMKMRRSGYLGTASGAQSQAFYLIERLLGLPNGTKTNRAQQLRYIIGERAFMDINRRTEGRSLLGRFEEDGGAVSSEGVRGALRVMDMSTMYFRARHIQMALGYLPTNAIGTGGTPAKKYLSNNIRPVFGYLYSDEELQELEDAFTAGQERRAERFTTIVELLDRKIEEHLAEV